LKIRRSDLLDNGIRFPADKREKTGHVVKWTPELREVVERCKRLSGDVIAMTWLLPSRWPGKAPDYRSVRDQWEKACEAAGV
jgi:hypothetical protein